MIRSMTGYGKASGESDLKKISVEIRSLNSKQLDLNIRMPQLYREKELEIRNWASREIGRGRVDLNITQEGGQDTSSFAISETQFYGYYKKLQELNTAINEDSPLLPVIMRLPDVVTTRQENLSEGEWEKLLSILTDALSKLNEFRTSEGKALAEDLIQRTEGIRSLLHEVGNFEKERTASVRQRIKNSLEEQNVAGAGTDRFEQEIIYYLEKLDITEEKVRLETHCNYFIETMEAAESEGRKLGFIVQEMGREINTIGSKANHAGIQRLVVQMKDELEKIREQINNVL